MYKGPYIKLYPFNRLNIVKTPEKNQTNQQCACKIFRLCTIPNRLLGRFPYSWKHENGTCVYETSVPWMIYSLAVIAILAVSSKCLMVHLKLNTSNLPVCLDSLTNLLNTIFVYLTVMHLVKRRAWIRFIKRLNKLSKDSLFCQRSRNTANTFQKNIVTVVCVFLFLQNAAYISLKYLTAPELSLHILFYRNLVILPVLSCVLWFSCIRYCMSMLICFENVVINYLGYRNIHPLKNIEFTHNVFTFGGISRGTTICDEKHYMPEHLKRTPRAQIIEYLRIRHEEMYQTVLLLEDLMSPQLVIYIVNEIAMNIISWYSIVVYLIYKFDNPTANSTHVLNCIFVVWHGAGIYWFFKNVHTLKRIVQGLKPILMSCALSTDTPEEHQQLRIFINKIVNQRAVTANDFFEIDLGNIGPVVGSVMTYVLVALQYEIPPQEQN